MWTIRDGRGFPAPMTRDGRAQPFWSSRSRAERVIATVPAYRGFEPVEVPWAAFSSEWVSDLTRDGIRVGLNWSGPRATGYDLTAQEVQRNVEASIRAATPRPGPPLVTKHPYLVQLLDALKLPDRGWREVDHWDGDTCAVGIARTGQRRPLVYVSVWTLPPGRYYFECETPTGPDATDYEVVEKGEDVDFDALLCAMERHLSVNRR